jgi:hypothetical protein
VSTPSVGRRSPAGCRKRRAREGRGHERRLRRARYLRVEQVVTGSRASSAAPSRPSPRSKTRL